MASGRLAMPKRTIVRRLRDEGFELDRQCGSHQQWKNYRTKRTVTVPDRPELIGEQVKTIFKQAGWPWTDSSPNALPKSKQLEGIPVPNQRIASPHHPNPPKLAPVVHFKVPAASAVPEIPSATEQTADSPPIATPAVNDDTSTKNEDADMPRNATVAKKKRRKFRDATEINLMAQDMMENPDETMTVVAARWEGAHQTAFTPIRSGKHPKLDPRTVLMLDIMFGRMSPMASKAKELVKEYQADPESMPLGVRRRMEGVVPVPPKEPVQLPPAKSTPKPPKVEAAPEAPKPEPTREPVIEHTKPEPKQQQLSLLRSEAVVVGYAPRSVGQAPVTIKGASTSLKELLEAAREVMKAMGITRVTLPDYGEIVIERKEILL